MPDELTKTDWGVCLSATHNPASFADRGCRNLGSQGNNGHLYPFGDRGAFRFWDKRVTAPVGGHYSGESNRHGETSKRRNPSANRGIGRPMLISSIKGRFIPYS